jgi:hypothetical protein
MVNTHMKGKLLISWPPDGEDDEYDRDLAWEDTTDYLTEILKDKNPSGKWHVEVENFGWRKMSGSADIVAKDGREFLQKILPETDCYFKIYEHGDVSLIINNAHHDSPDWSEHYYAVPDKPIKAKIDRQLKKK